jgi:hypothetical protein
MVTKSIGCVSDVMEFDKHLSSTAALRRSDVKIYVFALICFVLGGLDRQAGFFSAALLEV